jgi:hypothetical protein
VWKIPAEGGEAEPVTRGGGYYAEPSWDGRYLYYEKSKSNPSVWRVPVDGGEETEVVGGPVAADRGWAVSEGGLYFATIQAQMRRQEYTIQYLDFESGQVTELFQKEGPFYHHWLAVSPDEEWVLYGEQPLMTSELMLVENFR